MQYKFPSRSVLLLLLVWSFAASASDESKPVSLSAEDAATIKNIVLYISQEQTDACQSLVLNNTSQGLFDAAIAEIVLQGINEKDGFPPEGDLMTSRSLQVINKSMKDGSFIQSVNQIMQAPFEGKTWFESVEIHVADDSVDDEDLGNLLKKRANPENLPDAVAIMKNRFVFGLDHYKLWFVTNIEMYKPKANPKNVKTRSKPKLLHQQQFVSLYDIREHFEIPQTEQENRDLVTGGEFTNNLWNQDGGKLYFDTVKQLAVENAKMVKQFLLDQPPANLVIKPENAAVLALYEKPKDKKVRRQKMSPKQARRVERKNDAEVMQAMDPLDRKAYMMLKQYNYSRPVNIIESRPDGITARDQTKNFYYFVPRKNLKLVMESEIDPKEYDHLIAFPEEEPPAPQPVSSPQENGVKETGSDAEGT